MGQATASSCSRVVVGGGGWGQKEQGGVGGGRAWLPTYVCVKVADGVPKFCSLTLLSGTLAQRGARRRVDATIAAERAVGGGGGTTFAAVITHLVEGGFENALLFLSLCSLSYMPLFILLRTARESGHHVVRWEICRAVAAASAIVWAPLPEVRPTVSVGQTHRRRRRFECLPSGGHVGAPLCYWHRRDHPRRYRPGRGV